MIIHRKSSAYYAQANGQAKSTNKTLCRILTKTVEANHGDWEHKAFGLEVVMLMEYLV